MSAFPRIEPGTLPAECDMDGLHRLAPPRSLAPGREIVNLPEPPDPPTDPVVPPYVEPVCVFYHLILPFFVPQGNTSTITIDPPGVPGLLPDPGQQQIWPTLQFCFGTVVTVTVVPTAGCSVAFEEVDLMGNGRGVSPPGLLSANSTEHILMDQNKYIDVTVNCPPAVPDAILAETGDEIDTV